MLKKFTNVNTVVEENIATKKNTSSVEPLQKDLREIQSSEGVSKRAEWKQCAWYVRPATYSKLKRYVNRLQEMGRSSDASDVVDCALQMWMDDVK